MNGIMRICHIRISAFGMLRSSSSYKKFSCFHISQLLHFFFFFWYIEIREHTETPEHTGIYRNALETHNSHNSVHLRLSNSVFNLLLLE